MDNKRLLAKFLSEKLGFYDDKNIYRFLVEFEEEVEKIGDEVNE